VSKKKIDEMLPEEGALAVNYEHPVQLPDHVDVSQPNLGRRPAVVSVRLSAEEHAQLQRAAEKTSLPLSTLIRIWVMDRLRSDEQGSGGTVAQRLDRLEKAVFQRSA
jgi:hypothetical protein